eukprot:gene5752-biopygen11773
MSCSPCVGRVPRCQNGGGERTKSRRRPPVRPADRRAGEAAAHWGKRQRTRTGRGPDAGHTIESKEMDADRTRTGRGRGRFSLRAWAALRPPPTLRRCPSPPVDALAFTVDPAHPEKRSSASLHHVTHAVSPTTDGIQRKRRGKRPWLCQ